MLDQPIRREVPVQSRAATVATVDAEKRTVELVWSTGARVARFDWWSGKRFDEELSMEAKAVRLDRLNAGAPLLTDHRLYDSDAVIGVVERAWIEKGEGRAVVRFHTDEAAAAVFDKVRNQILRNVSITYQVNRYEIEKRDGVPELWRAVDWEPMEISLVPVGADPGAGTRSAPRAAPCEFVNRAQPAPQENAMDKPNPDAGNTPDPATTPQNRAPNPAPATDPEAIRREAIAAERKRAADIRARVASVKLPAEVADDLIARGVDLAHVGDAIIDELAKRGGGNVATPRVEIGQDNTDPAQVRGALTDALVARALSGRPAAAKFNPVERAAEFRGLPLLQVLAEYARALGHKVDQRQPAVALYDSLLALRSLSTSDFPLLLADVAHKAMLAEYALATPTYRIIFGRKTFTDFKPHNHMRLGDFPLPVLVNETGEVTYGTISETKQQIALATYARAIRITRRILINDDMGAFAAIPQMIARRVTDFENATAWALLALNSGGGPTILEKNMPSGRPLFHADHGNLAGSGTIIDVAAVSAGRAAMMKQATLDGMKINVMPRYLLCGPDKLTQAQQFCATPIVPATDATANPFKGALEPVGEANLSGNGWYLFADPAQAETLVYGYLQGQEGPRVRSEEPFTTDGLAVRVDLDFGVGGVDYRGGYKNAGA